MNIAEHVNFYILVQHSQLGEEPTDPFGVGLELDQTCIC